MAEHVTFKQEPVDLDYGETQSGQYSDKYCIPVQKGHVDQEKITLPPCVKVENELVQEQHFPVYMQQNDNFEKQNGDHITQNICANENKLHSISNYNNDSGMENNHGNQLERIPSSDTSLKIGTLNNTSSVSTRNIGQEDMSIISQGNDQFMDGNARDQEQLLDRESMFVLKENHTSEKSFECNICQEQFDTESAFQAHLYIHVKLIAPSKQGNIFDNGQNYFHLFCVDCGQGFSCPNELEVHRTKHHMGNIHQISDLDSNRNNCSMISTTFSDESHLKNNQSIEKGDESFPCETCGKHFKSRHSVARHARVHSNDKSKKSELTCSICGKAFRSAVCLKKHILSHSDEKRFGCTICGKTFSRKYYRKVHEETHSIQSDIRPFECKICQMAFRKSFQLKYHMGTHVKLTADMFSVKQCSVDGKETTKFECNACKKVFADKRYLGCHLFVKDGDGIHGKSVLMSNFQCEICGEEFSGNSGLMNHQRKHQIKTYSCDECREKFSNFTDLSLHKLLHHGVPRKEKKIKKVKCYVCDLEFDKQCELKVHLIESIGDGIHKRSNTHASQGKAWKCLICEKVCPNKTGLTLHMQRKHLQTTSQIDNSLSLQPPDQDSKPMDVELMSMEYSDDSNCSLSDQTRNSKGTKSLQSPLEHSETKNPEEIPSKSCDKYASELAQPSVANTETLDNLDFLPPHLKAILEENMKSVAKPVQNLITTVHTDNGVRYKCRLCPKLSFRFGYLKKHMLIHSKNIHCEICGKSFYHDNGLKEHTENQYQCSKCPQRFCKSLQFKKHHRQHQKENRLQCPHCPTWFQPRDHSKYTFHIGTHTGAKMFKCNICPSRFRNRFELKIHTRRHNGDKQCMCHQCGKLFVDSVGLKTHCKIHEEKREKFKCDECDKQYTHRESLKYHVRVQHKKERRKCKLCNKTFIHTASLRVHQQKHTGIKRFACEVCGNKFYTKFSLQTHALVHNRVKKFTCDICGNKFGQSSALYTHKKNIHHVHRKKENILEGKS